MSVSIVRKILKKEVPKEQQKAEHRKKLRVAAYCRVSTDMDEQLTSFATQIKAYIDRINSNPDWELAGIFADEGISGTSAEKRPKFNEMIKACDEGKIDLILTKSISRFARNAAECLTYARRLENNGVNIVFENDRIDTRNGCSKLLFTLLAAFAEEESRSISDNTKWGIRKRYENGEARWSKLYGYRRKQKNTSSNTSTAVLTAGTANTACTASTVSITDAAEAVGVAGTALSKKDFISALANDGIVALGEEFEENFTPHLKFLGGKKLNDLFPENTVPNNINTNTKNGVNNVSNVSNVMGGMDGMEEASSSAGADISSINTLTNLANFNHLFCDDYEVFPEEAKVVKKIFDLYEHGKSLQNIKAYLSRSNIPNPSGGPEWGVQAISIILQNERYAGDIKLQKYFTTDHLSHKCVKNDCTSIASFYIENHHKAIVTHKTFERVNKIRNMRIGDNQYPFGNKLKCPYCGSILHQRKIPGRKDSGWFCDEGHAHCQPSQHQVSDNVSENNAAIINSLASDNTGCCHNFVIPSPLVEAALKGAYAELSMERIETKLKHPKFGKAAKTLRSLKSRYKMFRNVDYWWVDDIVDHIEFGRHSYTQGQIEKMKRTGEDFIDDRVIRIFWRCGIVSTVASGVVTDKDAPQHLAELYNSHLKRKAEKAQRAEKKQVMKTAMA